MLATMDAATDLNTSHNTDAHRFEIHDGDSRVGLTQYAVVSPDGVHRVFFHTEVDDAYSGQGLAAQLVRAALDETIESGHRIVAVCPYVAAYVRKHPEYAEHVDATTKEHLDAVRAAARAS